MAYEKEGDLESKIRFSYRLRLPRIEKRLNLIVSGNVEDDYDVNRNPLDSTRERYDGKDDDSLNTALQYLFYSGHFVQA